MKWLIVAVFSSLLSSSYCYDEKRLLQAFSAYPNQLYPVLARLAILPNVNQFHDSTDHLRVYANFNNPDAAALLAESFVDNPQLYQTTLLNAGNNGSRLAKRKLERYLQATEQWQTLKALPWQLSELLQVDIAMALRQPLEPNAKQTTAKYSSDVCKAKMMLVVTDLASFKRVKLLKNRFEATFQLPLCLSEPVYFDATKITCSNNPKARIKCVFKNEHTLAQYQYDNLAIFSQKGIANAVGNRLYMRYSQSERVLLHELMHLYGFIDEYPLKTPLAKRLCNVEQQTRIAQNIVVLPKSDASQNEISVNGETWYTTRTCDNATGQAYKPVANTSNLELLDLPLPDLYLSWLQQAMTKDNSL